MTKDSMIIYRSFYEAIKSLPENSRLELYEAIFELGLNFNEIKLEGISKSLFTLIKPQIEANNRKAEAGMMNGKKGAEHGKKGGRPPKEKPPKNPQETPKKPSNVNVNDNVNVNVNSNYKKWDEKIFKEDITKNRKSYSDDLLIKFFRYWSEKDAKGKMKFQLQKTWETSKRLSTWASNNFQSKQSNNQQQAQPRSSLNKITLND